MTEEVIPGLSEDELQAQWNEVAAEEKGVPRPTEKPAAAEKAPVVADPIKEISERLARIEGSHNTLAGHIGGLKRSETEMRQLLAAANAATRKVDNSPSRAELQRAVADPAEWAELKRQHPAWAAATEKGMDARIAARLAEQASPFDQAAIDRMVAQRVAGETAAVRSEMIDSHLDAIVGSGDWRREINSPAFDAWIQGQRPEVQALADSAKMTDAAKLLRLFEQTRANTRQADSLTQKRQQKLDSASSVPQRGTRSAKPVSVEDMTPEQLWHYEAQQREKRRRGG